MATMSAIFTWQVRGRRLTISRPLVMGIVNVTPDSFPTADNSSPPVMPSGTPCAWWMKGRTCSTSAENRPGPDRNRFRWTTKSAASCPSLRRWPGGPTCQSPSTHQRPRWPVGLSKLAPRSSTMSQHYSATRTCQLSRGRPAPAPYSCTCAALRPRCNNPPNTPKASCPPGPLLPISLAGIATAGYSRRKPGP